MSGQWWNDDDVPEQHRDTAAPAPPTPPPAAPRPAPPGFEQPTTTPLPPVPVTTAASAGPRVPLGMAIAAVLALIGGLLVFTTLSGDESTDIVAGGEIFLERADEAGDDPFFDEYEQLVSFNPEDVTPPGASDIAATSPPVEAVTDDAPLTNAEILALSFKGGEPGLYGGTGNNATCNKAALIAFLETNPAKASAWAGAQRIPVTEIRPFVESLTTVALLADTRVTNHGFKNGVANPIQSVLQAGMAVMIDDTGTPRVKCGCGNPLNRPIAQSRTVVLKGDPWEGFDQGKIATVEPSSTPVDTFVLVSTDTGDAIERPAGTSGEADVVTSLAAPRPTDELAAGAAAAVADSLTGDEQALDPTSTPVPPPPSSSAPTSTTAPSSTLPGQTYCEKYQSYVDQSFEEFDDLWNTGSPDLERRWYEFVLRAMADLRASAPSELSDDWAVVEDTYSGNGPAGSFDLYDESPGLAAVEDRIVLHAENVCGLEF